MKKITKTATFSLLLSLFLLGACSKPIKLENFDHDIWKGDYKACQGKRKQFMESLEKQKDQLKRRSETEVMKILGHPDEAELDKRSKKYYTYYLEKGAQCDSSSKNTSGAYIKISFNSVRLSDEVVVIR